MLDTNDFSQEEIKKILDAADDLRRQFRSRKRHHYLLGKILFMMFYNRSLKTRTSLEAGMYQLGGHAHFLGPQDIYTPALPQDMIAYQTEAISDVVRVISRYGDGIAVRIYGDAAKWNIGMGHKVVQEFAKHSTIPVLNMETDMYHPFQALADVQAMRNTIPKLSGKKLVVSYAYSGDLKPLAVPESEILIGTQMAMDVVLAHPKGFELEDLVLSAAKPNADRYGGEFRVVNDMKEAFDGADFVHPKGWLPKKFFPPHNPSLDKAGARSYQEKFKDRICSRELMDRTDRGKYMHCGPAGRGQEIADDVIDNESNSLYFEQAENRLHAQKALMTMLMGDRSIGSNTFLPTIMWH